MIRTGHITLRQMSAHYDTDRAVRDDIISPRTTSSCSLRQVRLHERISLADMTLQCVRVYHHLRSGHLFEATCSGYYRKSNISDQRQPWIVYLAPIRWIYPWKDERHFRFRKRILLFLHVSNYAVTLRYNRRPTSHCETVTFS